MTLFKLLLFFIVKGILADVNETERSGVQLWRVQGDLDEDVIAEFYDRARLTEEIWKRDNRTIDFLIYEEEAADFIVFLDEHKVSHRILIDDVRQTVDEAMLNTFPTRRLAVQGGTFTWTSYPSLAEINTYLKKLASDYPKHCSLTELGKTSQKKPIYALKISNGKPYNVAILVDGGTHGREWTSVISALYFIDSLVKNYDKQPEYMKKRDWHVIPVLNPDGYDYSLTVDRLWKKNRRRLSGTCRGVDLNRNFAYNWGKDLTTLSACNQFYCGPMAFSEEETKAFKRLTDGTHFSGYLSIHSAGTKVMFPLTNEAVNRDDYHLHLDMTKNMCLAMRAVGHQSFTNGNIAKIGKKGYGMAIDWMYYEKRIPHSYLIETRSQNGLDLIPPKEILIAAKEVQAGIMKFAEKLR
uniref:Peptidase M14 domain-containing protein n=1 Tax=Heliothis virescens TaxID=7102 RepID=A0A2A4JFG8_HELVI